jgi:hypothetical protein
MKQKLYLIGIVSVLIASTGLIFKINHWPGAGVLITVGLMSVVLIFLPAALYSSYRAGSGNRTIHIVTLITCIVVFTAMLFKVMHWPYAGIAVSIAIPFPFVVFLPVYLVIISRNKAHDINKTVSVLLLLALHSVLTAMLSLNVTKQRIEDSFNLSGNYNRVEIALGASAVADNPVLVKIDEVLGIIDEYQQRILISGGITEDEWKDAPARLNNADSRYAAGMSLIESDDLEEGEKLGKSLRELLSILKATPGMEGLADVLPAILDLASVNSADDYLTAYFTDSYLSWTLIWMDGMETTLKMIRAVL